MKTISLPLLLSLLVVPVHAQTSVDKLVRALDSLGTLTYTHWKVSPDLRIPIKGDPTQPGFDDSKWDNLELNQRIYPDSCWIRKEIVLPPSYLGRPVEGKVKVLLSVDDYGYLWVNGDRRGYFPWDGEFELTANARPGQKFLLAIKAVNTGGPLRLLRAQLEMEATASLRERIRDFAISLRAGQKLLSFDTYQTNAAQKTDPGTDKSRMDAAEKRRLASLLQEKAGAVDIGALAEGSMERFGTSMDATLTALKPVADYAKRFTLVFDANAHIDAAWLWRERETVEICKNTFASVLAMMDSRPDFTYAQSSAAYYDWMETLYPDVFRRIQNRIKDGRWEVTGGMWVEPDCNIPGGESWMRHLLYAKRYFKEKFGVDVVIGWNPDSFGYNWNMPAFYSNAGIDAFVTQKIGWNERNVFPYRLFWWEGPDGSRILSYFPFDYVNIVDDPYRFTDWLRQFEANTGFTSMMVLFGVGDHGGGPSNEMLDRIEHLKRLPIYPRVEYSTTGQYLDWLRKQDLTGIPVWKNELYLEYHQGTFTTQAKVKEWNRKSEVLLTNAEKYSALSTLTGGKYREEDLREAWKHVLFNQFHDILPGSSIREVYLDAPERYKEAEAIGNHEIRAAIENIAQNINTGTVKNGTPVIIFNPLSWERSDVATLSLLEGETSPVAVFDPAGKEVPSQMVMTGRYTRDVLFRADKVPPLGYRTYTLRRQQPSVTTSTLKVTGTAIENEFFRLTLDPSSGCLSSILDKRSGTEVLAGPGNELQLLEDKPAQWDAWNVGLTGVKFPLRLLSVEAGELGPVRACLRVGYDYLKAGVKKEEPTPNFGSSFFTQSVILYAGVDRIDFRTDADWWESKTMVKVAFPLAAQDTAATYEIPYGSIRRSTLWRDSWDSAKVEVPAQRWADLSHGSSYGASLLNRSKYGYDVKGNVMRLSLLRSPIWPDPTADRGKHTIEYALYPHQGGWREAGTVLRGYEFNTPLLTVMTTRHKGTLPPEGAFVKLDPAGGVVLTTLKKAEDSDAWILQWYDAVGRETEAVLTLPRAPRSARLSDFLERDGTPVPFRGREVRVPTKKNSFVTLKVSF